MEFIEVYDGEKEIMVDLCNIAAVTLELKNDRLTVTLVSGKEIVISNRIHEELKRIYKTIERAIGEYEGMEEK